MFFHALTFAGSHGKLFEQETPLIFMPDYYKKLIHSKISNRFPQSMTLCNFFIYSQESVTPSPIFAQPNLVCTCGILKFITK